MNPTINLHVIGIALSAAAFGVFGLGILKRQSGKSFQPLPSFLLLIGALLFHLTYPHAGVATRATNLFMDLGLGMVLAGLLLAYKKGPHRMFWVPGALLVVIGMAGMGLTGLFNSCQKWSPFNEDLAEVLVELGPDDQVAEISPILNHFQAKAERAFLEVTFEESEDLAQYYVVSLPAEHVVALLEALNADDENVDQASINNPFFLEEPAANTSIGAQKGKFSANDPLLSQEWYAEKLNYNQVYSLISNRKPVRKMKVGIVDTGVDGKHEDLTSAFLTSPGNSDQHGHGTHCAGLAAGVTNNGKGIGSLNWEGRFLDVAGFPALDAKGRGSDRTVSQGIIQAAKAGSDVISLSLGGFAPLGAPKSQVDAIKFALKKGAIVVVAAGNANQDARMFSPANIEGVICVSAVDQQFNKAVFSNTNTTLKMPISAPGVDMMSSLPGNKYQNFSGTSMATPLVAGLIGVMKSFRPELTATEAYQILTKTGVNPREAAGIGRIVQPVAALGAVIPNDVASDN